MNNSKANYFEILGLKEDANDDQIRSAYRKLAIKWHPDKNPDNKKVAEEKFKEINEAYSVLSDPQRRREWENFRTGASANFDSSNFRRRSNFDPFDIFNQFFGGRDPFADDDFGDNFFSQMHNMGGGFSSSSFSSSSAMGTGGITKSVKQSTTIINGKRVTKTETTTVDANGKKTVEVKEETADDKGHTTTKKSLIDGFDHFDDSDEDEFGFGSKKKKSNKKQLK